MPTELKYEITCAKNNIRHKAYKKALELPAEKSVPILRKGLWHWDRSLRNKCAHSLVDILKGEAARFVLPLYAKGFLFASSSIECLRLHEDETLIKYLVRKKEGSNAISQIAQDFYLTTHYYQLKQAEEQIREETALHGRPARTVCYDYVDFLHGLEVESHAVFLYYQWVRNRRSLHKSFDSLYTTHVISKKSGGERQIESPHPILKSAQRLLLSIISETINLHSSCHGFRAERSTVTNATPHVGKDVVINLDLKDFFPSITANRVYGVFKAMKYKDEELSFLTDMTTFKGRLPQGAPTSPIIANIICSHLDKRLDGLAKKIGADYTRYADDITFSGAELIIRYIPLIKKIINEENFQLALQKLKIQRKGSRQNVTGLTVNTQVSVPRAIRRRLRAAVHRVSQGKDPFWKSQTLELQSLRGYLHYMSSVHPEEAKVMLNELP